MQRIYPKGLGMLPKKFLLVLHFKCMYFINTLNTTRSPAEKRKYTLFSLFINDLNFSFLFDN